MSYFERNGRLILLLWVSLLLFFTVVGYLAGNMVYQDRIASEIRQ